MPDNYTGNFRSAILNEPRLQSSATILRTPVGNVRPSTVAGRIPPPLPPSPYDTQTAQHSSYMSTAGIGGLGYGGGGYSSPFGVGYGGGYGTGYGGFGNSFGGYGGYRFGGGSYLNPNDPENHFIQMAEESSRPAFQSIESLVAAIGNIAAMLDSTFFAITSSFRAILGVAANFGRLRGVFTQFWQTFAIFRGLTWIYKKLLYWLRLSNIDPSSAVFKEAFAVASSQAATGGNLPPSPPSIKGQSPWPVIVFLSFIFTAPYVIMKLLGNVANSAREESRNPKTWINPIPTQVMYDFNARNSHELTIRAGQSILIAPKEVQNTHNLLKTGWALATIDNETSGLIPITYIQMAMKHEQRQQQQQQPQQLQEQEPNLAQQLEKKKNKMENLFNDNFIVNDAAATTIQDEEVIKSESKIEENCSQSIPSISASTISIQNTSNGGGGSSPLNSSRRNSSSSLPVIPEVDDSGVETL